MSRRLEEEQRRAVADCVERVIDLPPLWATDALAAVLCQLTTSIGNNNVMWLARSQAVRRLLNSPARRTNGDVFVRMLRGLSQEERFDLLTRLAEGSLSADLQMQLGFRMQHRGHMAAFKLNRTVQQ